MRIGIGIDTSGTLDQLLPRFKQAEDDGFASAWVSNIFGYDGITLLALAGQVTSRIEMGTFVVPTYPRHPAAIIQQALTAAAATQNRFVLGIGLSHKIVIEDMFGLDFSKPIRHSRDYLAILDRALTGEPTRHDGPAYKVAFQFSVPGAKKPPVVVAALGPQMLRLAGQLADGTAVWMGGPKYLAETAVPTISKAAAEAGRPAPRIVAGFPIAVTNQREAALEAASQSFAMYGTLPSYRAIMDVEGVADASGIAIVGDEAEVTRQLRGLRDAGVTDLNASPFGVPEDREAPARTRALLKDLANRGL